MSSDRVLKQKQLANERWYVENFGFKIKNAMDYYRQGRLQYTKGHYDMATKCLEIFLAGSPMVGVAALHLLGHCHAKNKNLQKAFECFLGCIRLSFEEDWQTCVETLFDIDAEELKFIESEEQAVKKQELIKDIQQREKDAEKKRKAEKKILKSLRLEAELKELKNAATPASTGNSLKVGTVRAGGSGNVDGPEKKGVEEGRESRKGGVGGGEEKAGEIEEDKSKVKQKEGTEKLSVLTDTAHGKPTPSGEGIGKDEKHKEDDEKYEEDEKDGEEESVLPTDPSNSEPPSSSSSAADPASASDMSFEPPPGFVERVEKERILEAKEEEAKNKDAQLVGDH